MLDRMDISSIRGAYCGCEDIAQRIAELKVTSQRDKKEVIRLGKHLESISSALRKVTAKLGD